MSTQAQRDGGLAFPGERGEMDENSRGERMPITVQYGGMSLRDWFAGQALAGIAADIPAKLVEELAGGIRGGMWQAKAAYVLADAMLAERAKAEGKAP